jgi:hypothetical protein
MEGNIKLSICIFCNHTPSIEGEGMCSYCKEVHWKKKREKKLNVEKN